MLRLIAVVATSIGGAVLPAWAADIPIINAGFEQVVLPCAPAAGCYSVSNVAGWIGSGAVATFKPSTGSGGIFPGGIPEGVNVAALGDTLGSTGVLVQTLGALLQPHTVYTLVFSVGARTDFVFAGCSVELLAGTTTLASDSTLAPPSGTFVTGRIVYSSNSANPSLLGQALGIRLTANGRGTAVFDKISLDATPTLISSSTSQIASGGGWKTTLTVVNLSSTQNPVRVALWGDDGRPLTLPVIVTQQGIPQLGTAASVDRTLESGATLLIESEAPAASATLVGWAEVSSSGPVAGFAIFRQRDQNGRDSEGTAPLEGGRSSSLVLPFDSTTGFATGVALVNLANQAVIVNATIRDDNGAQIGLQAVALPAMGHTSFAVADRFSITAGRRGIIEFLNPAGGAITGLGLRFSPSGSFTSVPVTAR